VLREIARLFREEPDRIAKNRDALMQRLAEKARPAGKVVVGEAELDRAANGIARAIDLNHGGLHGAPKFPQCALFELLWRAGLRAPHDENPSRTAAPAFLRPRAAHARAHLRRRHLRPPRRRLSPLFGRRALARCRTSRNALRQRPAARAARRSRTRRPACRSIASAPRDRRLARARDDHAEGAFSASLDADSEGEEGKFYVWSLDEIVQALGPDDGAFVAAQYDVTPEGNFEGHNILKRLKHLPRSMDPAEDSARLAVLRGKLLRLRENRVRPGLDDKVLADWNGLMIAALAKRRRPARRARLDRHGEETFGFIAAEMTRGDRFGHSWRAGGCCSRASRRTLPAWARLRSRCTRRPASAPISIPRSPGSTRSIRHYANPDNGGYFLTADDAEGLVVRPAPRTTTRRRTRTRSRPRTWCGSRCSPATIAGASRPTHCSTACCSAAGQNLIGHAALLNALDLRLRAPRSW
jgi:uncharacterized protein YyaL (SSP411 family)